MSDQPAAAFPRELDGLADALVTHPATPFRVTVSVELTEPTVGWSLVELHAVDGNAFLALHTAAAAVEEALHVHPVTRDGSTRAAGRHVAGVQL